MSRFLSETNINILEHYIQVNQPSEILPAISECYREQAIEDWKTINDPETLPTTYLQFADSAYGMTSYGFYKTKEGLIFLVTAFCGELSAYYKVQPNWNILIPYDQLYPPETNFITPDDDNATEVTEPIESASETEPNTPDSEEHLSNTTICII